MNMINQKALPSPRFPIMSRKQIEAAKDILEAQDHVDILAQRLIEAQRVVSKIAFDIAMQNRLIAYYQNNINADRKSV